MTTGPATGAAAFEGRWSAFLRDVGHAFSHTRPIPRLHCHTMQSILPDSVRAAVTGGRLAHLVTLNADGSPQVTCVWVGIDGDELVTAHLGAYQKVKNVARDPRVALTLETGYTGPSGMAECLVVYGRARVVEGGAPELLQELAQVYIGPGVKFPPIDNPPPGYVLHIAPERFSGHGPWATA